MHEPYTKNKQSNQGLQVGFSIVTLQVVHSPNVRYKLDFKGVPQQNVPCQLFSRLEDSRLPCCLFICNCCLRNIIKYSYS